MCRTNVWRSSVAVASTVFLTAWAPNSESVRVVDALSASLPTQVADERGLPAPVDAKSGEGAEFRLLRQRDERGEIAPDALSRALREREAMLPSLGTPLHVTPEVAGVRHSGWTTLGPLGLFGGRLKTIDIDPTDSRQLLVGAATGGIWHSEDAGATWAPVDDFLASLSISSLARDAGDPATIYAGTSEYYYTATQGIGILKSTDGGRSWLRLSGTDPAKSNHWTYITHVATHPAAAGTVLVSTWAGAFRSIDAGATWTEVYTRTAFDGLLTLVSDVEINPVTPNQILLGLEDSAVAYSSNGGSTWSTVQIAAPVNQRHTGGVQLAFSKTVNGLVYASVDRNGGEVWLSSDAGHTWALVGAPQHIADAASNTIWVDPTNAQHLVIGGIDLLRSTDGGHTFVKISDWNQWPTSAHADHHAIVAEAGYDGAGNARLYDASDGGIYRANNVLATTTVSGWTNLNNGLNAVQFWSGTASPAAGGIFIGGTQDNGTLAQLGYGWFRWFGGDGGVTAIDPSNPALWYGEYSHAAVFRTFNGGASASYICAGITDSEVGTGPNAPCGPGTTAEANFVAPFVLDPNLLARILVGANSLWVSDRAQAPAPTWRAIKAPSPNKTSSGSGNWISAVTVRPGDSNTVWVGHNNGELYVSTNALSSNPMWRAVSGLPARFISRIVFDPSNANRMYVILGGFVKGNIYFTDNGGTSWTGIGMALPGAPIYTLAVARINSQMLYVGTEVGVFATENGGQSWSASNDGPANVPVEDLSWLADNALVAATHGRGAFLALTDGSGPADVVEYYNAQLDHYFVTASASDIDILDRGVISGWVRTGETFQAFLTQASGGPLVYPVCRFYIPPEHGNSHFFSVLASDCAALLAAAADPTHYPDFSGYVEESHGRFFHRAAGCEAATVPLAKCRCSDCGTSVSIRIIATRLTERTVEDMQARNYVLEGAPPNHAVMCASM